MSFVGSKNVYASSSETEISVNDRAQFVMATYQVEVSKQSEFLSLLLEAERVMRSEKLITNSPILRMRSKANHKLILEVFEWVDDTAFDRAQANPKVLAIWGKFESIWETGGFGVSLFPEAAQPWAQYDTFR
jgi:hypothetical protein